MPIQASLINHIQQEIVKQLLYRGDPSKMPRSRFRRFERFRRRWRRLAELGVVVSVGFTGDSCGNILDEAIIRTGSHGYAAKVPCQPLTSLGRFIVVVVFPFEMILTVPRGTA